MMSHRAMLAVLLVIGGGAARGAAELPVVRVAPVEPAPVIDGALSDACWQRPPDARDFTALGGRTPAAQPTEAWLARDDAWLFLAVKCHDTRAATVAREAERDRDVLRDDAVALFLSPGADDAGTFQFAFNARGVQAESRADGQIPWDAHWRSAAVLDPEHNAWTAEAAIPLFYLTDRAGTNRWRMNIVRHRRQAPEETSSWAALPGPGFHVPERFGVLEGLEQVKGKPVFAPVITGVEAGPYVDIPRRCYEVKVALHNQGGAPGRLTLDALDITPAGQVRSAPLEQALGPGPGSRVTGTVSLDIEDFIAARETRVTAALTDQLGAWEWVVRADRSRAANPLRVAMDRSYYTDETTAHLVFGTSLPRAALEDLRLRVQVRAPGAAAVTSRVTAVEGRVALPLEGLPAGAYNVQADLLGPDGEAFEHIRETCRLIRREPATAGNEVKTDRWNNCLLVNGKPFFSLGYFGVRPESFGMLAGMGFNTVLRWQRLELPDLVAYLDAARAHGLFVVDPPDYSIAPPRAVFEPTYPEKMREGIRDKLPGYLAAVREHPALLAYYGPDEPGAEFHKVACHELAAALNAGDGRHPNLQLFCHYFPTSADWLDFWDVGALDIYRLDSVSYLAEAALGKAAVALLHKPYWLVPLGESGLAPSILPPRQQRSQTYLSLIHGACGITYFIWPVSHVDTYAMLKTLAAEIARMAPALLTRGPPQSVSAEPAGARTQVQVLLKPWPEGGQILLAANIAEAPVAVRFAVSSLAAGSAVANLFGPETWAVTNGGFSDRLEALGTRVYRLSGTTMTGSEPVEIRLSLEPEPGAAAARPARGPAARSNNILPNSSFERATVPGMPDMWVFMPGRSYTEDTLIGKPDALVALDEAEAFEGRVAVRLRGIELILTRPTIAWKWAQMVPMEPGKDYVFSIHMKADRDDVEVVLWRGSTKPTFVRVGRQWARYSCVGGNQGGLQMRIPSGAGTAPPEQAATVWLDAAQLEAGREPTPYVHDTWTPD